MAPYPPSHPTLISRLIFMSRWLQLPLYRGLTLVHIAFLLSGIAIAAVDRVMPAPGMHDMPSAPH
jgi:uncharacterized membrane protein YqhA